MADREERPPGGREFEAVRIEPEGWTCLAPWIQTPGGEWYRPHVVGVHTEETCARLARQINGAMRCGPDPLIEMWRNRAQRAEAKIERVRVEVLREAAQRVEDTGWAHRAPYADLLRDMAERVSED